MTKNSLVYIFSVLIKQIFCYTSFMKTDFIDQIEPTPKLHSKKCKLIAFGIRFFLQYSLYLLVVIMWYEYDYFIAIASLLLGFIVIGIIRSKLRNSVIPPSQREYLYTDQGIADWYTARQLCF